MTRGNTPHYESHDRFPSSPDPSPARGDGSFVSRLRDFHINPPHQGRWLITPWPNTCAQAQAGVSCRKPFISCRKPFIDCTNRLQSCDLSSTFRATLSWAGSVNMIFYNLGACVVVGFASIYRRFVHVPDRTWSCFEWNLHRPALPWCHAQIAHGDTDPDPKSRPKDTASLPKLFTA